MTMRRSVSPRPGDERGSVLVLVAVSLLVFLLGAAFVVDIGNARQVARNYQNAADGASLAGAQELKFGQLEAQKAVEYAADYAFQTLLSLSRPAESLCSDPQFAGEVPSGGGATGAPHCYALGGVRVYVTTPWDDQVANGTTLPGGNESSQIHVKVCGQVVTGFSRVAGINLIRPCRLATAMALGSGPCALCVLEQNGQGALTMSGNGNATIAGSSAWVNSDSSQAATNPGGGTFIASGGFYVRGGFTGIFAPPPTVGVPKIQDPLAWLPEPRSLQSPPWQDWTTLPLYNDLTLECENPGDTVTIPYGIYPSIKVIPRGPRTCDGTNTIRLTGQYVIRHEFLIKTDARVEAPLPGVTIYFACDNFPENPCDPGQHAYFEQTGNGDLDLHASTAPAGHPYNNLLFFFDRNNQTQQNRFSGGGVVTSLTGTIYGPSARIELSGSGDYRSLFVVGKMEITGNGLVDITYDPSEQVPMYLPSLIS